MTEQWRFCPDHEEAYEVSDHGRVRSYRRDAGGRLADPRMLTPRPNRDGHLKLKLRRNGKPHWPFVHTLVLEAFVGPRPKGLVACHWNGVKADNRLENLRWDTYSANCMDNIRLGVRQGQLPGQDHVLAKLCDEDIRCIRAEPFFRGINLMLARCFGVRPKTIQRIRNGHEWAHVPQYL